MPGILEWLNDPASQGLLNMSAGLMQAGGPSPTPTSFGQALGTGMTRGLQGMQQAQAAQQQSKLLDLHGKLYGSQADKLDEDVKRQQRLAAIMGGAADMPQLASAGPMGALGPMGGK
jgi:hypothetical protein